MKQFVRAIVLFALTSGAIGHASAQSLQARYEQFLEQTVWPEAQANGVSRAVFDRTLGAKRLDTSIPGLVEPGGKGTPREQRQAEFSSPANYFNERNLGGVVSGGKARLSRYGDTLARIERQYGVPGRIVVAIWGRESGFGGADIPHDAFTVLGTKAFMATRPDLFRKELIAAMQMIEQGRATAADMRSSWAGALGQPQFLPSSYLAHAVDFDGNGKADIWNSEADTLASIANYLKQFGWQAGRDWGFEVTLPDNLACTLEGPDQGFAFSKWSEMGVRRVNGRPFPESERTREGFLVMPAGRNGPAFIVTANFYVLKAYNESDLYALFVGHAADRIQYGGGPFVGAFGRTEKLLRSDIAAMQRALEAKGYDVGGADGLPGFRTRRSIGDWQLQNGDKPTCFPDAALVQALR